MKQRKHIPGVLALWAVFTVAAPAAQLFEDFSSDPTARGWKVHGDTNFFVWNAANQNLEVTWDSSQSNSFFYLPLGTMVSEQDDFQFGFDLKMSDIRIGSTPGKRFTFQIALGLMNQTNTLATNLFIGTGNGVRNLVEFDYFPDSGFGATFALAVVKTNSAYEYSHNYPLEMTTDDLYHLQITYTSSNKTMQMSATCNGVLFGLGTNSSMNPLVFTNQAGFRVNCFSVTSYNDGKGTGSVLAHGVVDNVSVTCPDPPVAKIQGGLTNGNWEIGLSSQTNWVYGLQRSADMKTWTNVATVNGGGPIALRDTNRPTSKPGFYRIMATKP
ncbi:MAG: hypothetical protein WCO56_06450 [Verrucomicrobiota bacterium]